MANNSGVNRAEVTAGSGLSKEAVDKAVKALISLASSATEADQVVREFRPDLDGEDTVALLTSKYNYVSVLFGVNQEARATCNPLNSTDFEVAVTNYYSLLSVLILRKWG